ncbi:MAG: hypothetical protein HYS77_02030 [Candidatus Rokubacteria bacterium]|nr:hypothetical protein [Candidatus Rokubacteria bacterium]
MAAKGHAPTTAARRRRTMTAWASGTSANARKISWASPPRSSSTNASTHRACRPRPSSSSLRKYAARPPSATAVVRPKPKKSSEWAVA